MPKRKTSKRKKSPKNKNKIPMFNKYQINHLEELHQISKKQDEDIEKLLNTYQSLINELNLDNNEYNEIFNEYKNNTTENIRKELICK